MSPVELEGSVLAGILFVAAGVVVATTVRRLYFPAWRGSLAVTTVVLVWLCWALGLSQLLGAFGLLRRMALLGGAVVTAAGALALARRRPAAAEPDPPEAGADPPDAGPPGPAGDGWRPVALSVATVVLVLFVLAIWAARTVIALHRGINDPDSLGYHLPFIATFAHSGYPDQHRLLIPLLPVQFFPANDELLGAVALAITHSFAFAAAKNLLFGAFTIVAAHALGKAYGAGRLAMAATAVVLGYPVVMFSQPGEAVNDALLVLLLVGGLAVLASARGRPAPYVLALACAGAALGVKFSGIVPATALAVVALVLLLARVARHRWRWAAAGLAAAAAMGGSWYARNAINYGNPIPPVHLALGPIHLHTVHGVDAAIAYSVAHYALHGRLLKTFASGLFRALGPLVPVSAAGCALGVVTGLRARDGFRRGLSAFAVVALVGYVFTPASAYGPPSAVPESFVINLHYAAPGLLAAMLAGAIALRGQRWAWVLPVVALVAVAGGISRGRGISVWSPELGGAGFVFLLVAVMVGGVAAAAWFQPRWRRWGVPGAATAAAAALVGVAVAAGHYPSRQSTDPLVRWAATVPGSRIGAFNLNLADLYGPHAQNRVDIISQVVDGAAMPIVTCHEWKQAMVDGHYDFAAAISSTGWSRWLAADPAFHLVADEQAGATVDELVNDRRGLTVVFQVVGPPKVNCPDV